MQRYNPYETVLGVNNVSGLQLKWKSILGNVLYESNIQSSPAVVNGVVYVGSDSNRTLSALNAITGAQLWSYATGSNVNSSPAVVNGVIYVGSQDGNVYALNADTGAKLWSYATEDLYPVTSSPAVVNGVVYVGSGYGGGMCMR